MWIILNQFRCHHICRFFQYRKSSKRLWFYDKLFNFLHPLFSSSAETKLPEESARFVYCTISLIYVSRRKGVGDRINGHCAHSVAFYPSLPIETCHYLAKKDELRKPSSVSSHYSVSVSNRQFLWPAGNISLHQELVF